MACYGDQTDVYEQKNEKAIRAFLDTRPMLVDNLAYDVHERQTAFPLQQEGQSLGSAITPMCHDNTKTFLAGEEQGLALPSKADLILPKQPMRPQALESNPEDYCRLRIPRL